MPTKFEIPSRRVTHCAPCEFHKLTGSLHVRCGEGSWRQYSCMNPQAFDDLDNVPQKDPEKEKLRQRMIGMMLTYGRDIGKTEEQPEWCPLRRENP